MTSVSADEIAASDTMLKLIAQAMTILFTLHLPLNGALPEVADSEVPFLRDDCRLQRS
jgi:hypothetical protein